MENVIHVYIEPDLLKYLTTNNFRTDTVLNNQSIDTIEVSGINIRKHSFKVKFIGVKTFNQLGKFEIDGRAQLGIMVFQVKRQKDNGMRVLAVINGKKEFLQVDTLRTLCFAIPGLVKKHAVLRDVIERDSIYKCQSRPRGLCVIINNQNFEDSNGNVLFSTRLGSEFDVHNLQNLFKCLDLKVIVHSDLSDSDIIQVMKKISLQDHSHYDMFVCCVLSHGRNGSILGVNNLEVPILEITSTFRNRGCPSLAGKPKLFFIQACQGSRPQRGMIQTDVRPDEENTKILPDGSDFLIACSTEPGYESFRHTSRGSFFVNSLVKHLKAPNRSIVDVLTDVCSDVSSENFNNCCKQVPWFTSTLTKTLMFDQASHYVNTR